MRTPGGGNISLVPETGIAVVDGETVATSLPFFLRLEPVELISACRWVHIRYSSSYFDEPVRPLIRFVTASGKSFVQPMNGPVLGSAEWVGRVPDNTVLVSISPGRRLGPFSFRIDSIRPISRRTLMRRALRSEPGWTYWALRSRWLNSREEAWQALKYAVAGTPIAQYDKWHARYKRGIEPEGLDKPRSDWSVTPHVHLLMTASPTNAHTFLETLKSLKAQFYPRWSLHVAIDQGVPPRIATSIGREVENDPRTSLIAANSAKALNFSDNDRLAVITCGDTLPVEALAIVAEAFVLKPDLTIIYSDEDRGAGSRSRPVFKPGWSPVFNRHVPYVGRLTCIRYGALKTHGFTGARLLHEEASVIGEILATAKSDQVAHLSRILYHGRGVAADQDISRPSVHSSAMAEADWPDVTIVIPTRDRADLLAACVQGLREKTVYGAWHAVIVDNESTQRNARSLLKQIANDPRFTVLEKGGPFNYSLLSNAGARATNTPFLVFMNNDVQVLDADWLKKLMRWAVRPYAGAVGAKLLFPNGKIQHAGVVLGMGGIAGHVYRRSPSSEPGYLHQLQATREVLAVTGACFAIERTKFEAAGGFEEEHLPVDLNDIDLCLRIAGKGWTNLCVHDATLIHVQSASRGIDRNPFELYRRERSYFTTQWTEAMRDDPYFHPGFSLFSQTPMLA